MDSKTHIVRKDKRTQIRKKRLYVNYYPTADDPEIFASRYHKPIPKKEYILYQDLELILYCVLGLNLREIAKLYYLTPARIAAILHSRKLFWFYKECYKFRSKSKFNDHMKHLG